MAPEEQGNFCHRNYLETNFRTDILQHANRQTGNNKLYYVNSHVAGQILICCPDILTRRNRYKKMWK